MINRKRNITLHAWLTKEEKELIKTVAKLKGMSITDLLMKLVKNEYEKLEKEQLKK